MNGSARLSVVIVDDDADHAMIARTVLASVAPDVPVEVCLDARLVLGQLRAAPHPAVVLMDRMLDGVESLPLVGEVTRARPDLYLVLLSSSLSEEDAVRAISAGAREAAEKPASLERWRALMRGVMERALQPAAGLGADRASP